MQSAVAYSIASSHEDFHEVTSVSSCADLNSQSVFPRTASQGMDLCLEFRSTTTVHSYQQIPPTNFDQWIANCPIPPILDMDSFTNFSIHHAVLDQFSIHHDLLITFPNFPLEALRHVNFATNSFNSLLLRSPASSPR